MVDRHDHRDEREVASDQPAISVKQRLRIDQRDKREILESYKEDYEKRGDPDRNDAPIAGEKKSFNPLSPIRYRNCSITIANPRPFLTYL